MNIKIRSSNTSYCLILVVTKADLLYIQQTYWENINFLHNVLDIEDCRDEFFSEHFVKTAIAINT